MCDALTEAYLCWTSLYCASTPRPFASFKDDFFARNRVIFERVKDEFVEGARSLLLGAMGGPFIGAAIGSMVPASLAEALFNSLNIDEICEWREQAWKNAQQRIDAGGRLSVPA
jgi:hypothetical protein